MPDPLRSQVGRWVRSDSPDLSRWLATEPAIERAALGWALKAECYDAWSTEPRLAVVCAGLLASLAELEPRPPLPALAAWTAGIAALAEGRSQDALVQFEHAGSAFDAEGDAQHAAQTRVPAIVALAMLGRDAEAVRHAESARTLFLGLGDSRSAGKVELNLATMLSRADRHTEAAVYYKEAALRFARLGDAEHSIMADIGLANALTWAFDLDEAAFVNARARARAGTRGFAVLEAQAELAIGRIELIRGSHRAALGALSRASRGLESAGATAASRIEADASLADGYAAVGLLPEAVSLYARVTEAARVAGLPVEQARARLERGRALHRLARFEEAQLELGEARRLFLEQGNSASVALADLVCAEVSLAAGKSEPAHRLALAALESLRASPLIGWVLEARLIAVVAGWRLGRRSGAREELSAILAASQTMVPLQVRARVQLAALEHNDGSFAAAREHLDHALSLVEAQRATLPSDELRSAIAAQSEQATDLLVEVVIDEGLPLGDRVLLAIERGRARAWADGLDARPQARAGSVPGLARLGLLRVQQRQAISDAEMHRAAGLERAIEQLERDLLEAHRRAVMSESAPAGTPRRAPVDRVDLWRQLATDQALVAYHVVGARLVICVAVDGQVHTVVSGSAGIDDRVRSLRFQLSGLQLGAPQRTGHEAQLLDRVRIHLRALYDKLWAPVARWLRPGQRVVVLPHRQINYVPFAALHDGADWLVHRHELTCAPSLAAWSVLQGRLIRPLQRLTAFGHDSASLPHVEREIDAVAAAFGDRCTTRRDAQATSAALRELGPGTDVLHLACHGEFRADNPAFSALHLADGPFSLHDLGDIDLRASVVVLSACETGMSRVDPGGELMGLVRGFTLAGASSVIASHWAVNDASTAALMGSMYARLAQGARPAAALQAVQSGMAAAGLHPYHWAGFVAHGRG